MTLKVCLSVAVFPASRGRACSAAHVTAEAYFETLSSPILSLFFSVHAQLSGYVLHQQMGPQSYETAGLSMRIRASMLIPLISSATFVHSLPSQNNISSNIQVLLRHLATRLK